MFRYKGNGQWILAAGVRDTVQQARGGGALRVALCGASSNIYYFVLVLCYEYDLKTLDFRVGLLHFKIQII